MSRQLGFESEAQAIQFLSGLGYICLAQNVSSDRGEVDLVVKGPKDEIVFVEVKFRQVLDERAFEAISKKKQGALIYTAQCYLHEHPELEGDFSFGILLHNQQEWIWIPDAFDGDTCSP